MNLLYLIIAIVCVAVFLCVGYYLGGKNKKSDSDKSELLQAMDLRVAELTNVIKERDNALREQSDQISNLKSERDVLKTNVENKENQLLSQKDNYESQLSKQKSLFEEQLTEQKNNAEKLQNSEIARNVKRETELKEDCEKQISSLKSEYEKQIESIKREAEKNRLQKEKESADFQEEEKRRNSEMIKNMKDAFNAQIAELKSAHEKQLNQTKDGANKQIEALREMNKEQVESQMKLIKEQMQTTSEKILKHRQDELNERNKEQVSKIIDPLQKSLKDMQEALNKSKEQQSEAMTRLDETIKINMQKSVELGETADRLTRALTGEVKVQGNFGELKLKQLLEDLELREGEQFDTQETLRDKAGKSLKGDDGKGMIPDFILHFPNNRHVVVDSKMSLTDYERYMNSEDGSSEKSDFLKAHIASVRAQVKRLAKKDYTKFLPDGINRLNFAIMYVPIEGALNLALLNDATLWREAYDQGVMILGPQTMYMNLRVLEMMWTQVRQLKNQQVMIDAANSVIDRVQDFGIRFMDVESSMNDTIKKISKLKISTAESGPSIITAARKLLNAGAKENKKKKSLVEMDDTIFLDTDSSLILPE